MLELKGKYCKDCKVFIDEVEDEALATIYSILNHPNFTDAKIRIMPDTHAGRSVVIGFTCPITNSVNPNHVGVDISCMIDTYVLDRKIDPKDYAIIEHRVRKEIPFGFDIHKTRQFEMKEFIKFIKSFYDKQKAAWSEMILDFDISEKGISDWLRRIHMDEGTFYKSISSVGSGNHFIEFGNLSNKESSAFTIHCGSRNLGVKVCSYWNAVAQNPTALKAKFKEELQTLKKTCKNKKELPEKIAILKEKLDADVSLSNGYLSGYDMKGYITDMVIASAYAHFNHYIIAKKIEGILLQVNQAKVVERIVSVHNYIDFQDHTIRKGAIRSYKGEQMVIPFNMRDGLAICEGKSNEDWNYSAPHGSGRLLSRSKCKELLNLEEFKKQMEGIYSTSVTKGTLDEAPNAYKDTAVIVDAIQDTCNILYFVKPTINLKATDGHA